MKIFISWSGSKSKDIAVLLSEWIACVIQAVDPWMSSKDIERGALWFNELYSQLADISLGIVCITKENRSNPWILFEAGALAKGLTTSRVCTFLIDLKNSDIESSNPLSHFNHTAPTKEGLLQLVRTINLSIGENKIKENILHSVFETYWPQFEESFKEIELMNIDLNSEVIDEVRKPESIMLDVLESVRSLSNRLERIETGPVNKPGSFLVNDYDLGPLLDYELSPIERRLLKTEIRAAFQQTKDIKKVKALLMNRDWSEHQLNEAINFESIRNFK